MDLSEFSRLKDKSNYSRHPWETSRKNVLHAFLKQSKINFPVDRIVDIGSGDAFVIHTLVERGMAKEYYAIDIEYTEEVIFQLKQNNNNSNVVYLQNIEEYFQKFPSEVPTLFLCMDVLEHIENEKVILDNLKHNPNNFYFFAVPAFQSVFSSHDVLLGHYRRYTLNQLEKLLVDNQFTIVDKGYYFSTLLLFRNLDKILKKDKDASIDNWEGGKLKTKIINTILAVDFKFSLILKKLGLTIPGLSTYCLCKK